MIRALQTTTILPSHDGCVIFFKIDKRPGESNQTMMSLTTKVRAKDCKTDSLSLWNSETRRKTLENSHRLRNTERIWKTQQDTKRPWHVMTDHFSLINLESLWSLSNSFTNACWRLVLSSCCWSLKQTYPPAAAQPLHAQQTPAEQQSRSAPRWAPAAPRSAPRWAQPATTLPPPPTSQLSTGRPVLVCLWGHRRHLVNIHFWPNFDPLIQQKLPCL